MVVVKHVLQQEVPLESRTLKPCPLCTEGRGQMRTNTAGDRFWVGCDSCLMTGPKRRRPNWAVEDWNGIARLDQKEEAHD